MLVFSVNRNEVQVRHEKDITRNFKIMSMYFSVMIMQQTMVDVYYHQMNNVSTVLKHSG